MVLDEAEIVHKVTIVPRGQAGGYAMMLPKQDLLNDRTRITRQNMWFIGWTSI